MSTKQTTETASASTQSTAEASETDRAGFDAMVRARQFLGPGAKEKRVRLLSEMFCAASMAGYGEGYNQGKADQIALAEIEAAKKKPEPAPAPIPQAVPAPPESPLRSAFGILGEWCVRSSTPITIGPR